MYFSKNSRYVLQKANLLSPSSYFFTCFKGTDKNLSIKFPKEDPTKPSLRINIPKDSERSLMKALSSRNDIEPRSKSLMRPRTTALNDNFPDNSIKKSESEIQLTSVTKELLSSEKDSKFYTVDFNQDNNIKVENETECKNSSPTSINEKSIDETLANEQFSEDSKAGPTLGDTEVKAADQISQDSPKNGTTDYANMINEPDNLYIIIDVPGKNEENSAQASDESAKEDKATTSQNLQNNISAASKGKRGSKLPRSKADFKKSENFNEKNKAKAKVTNNKIDVAKKFTKADSKIKFEVHEIDDAATYVLQLKFKKNLQGKPTAVGWVPEKELNTRSVGLNFSDAPIRARDPKKGIKGIGKEIKIIEDLPQLIKYAELKNSQKNFVKKEKIEDESWKPKVHAPVFGLQSSAELRLETSDENIQKEESRNVEDSDPQYLFLENSLNVNPESTCAAPEQTGVEVKPEEQPVALATEKFGPREYVTLVSSLPITATSTNTTSSADFESKTETKIKIETKPEIKLETKIQTKADAPTSKVDKNLTPPAYVQDHESLELSGNNNPMYYEYPPKMNPESTSWKQSSYLKIQKDNDFCTEDKRPLEKKKSYRSIKKGSYSDKKKPSSGKHAESHFHSDSKVVSGLEKGEKDVSDFKTCARMMTITTEKSPMYPPMFSAAFPPTLCEALQGRSKILGFKRESLFHHKWSNKPEVFSKEFNLNSKLHMDKVTEISENSILFPKDNNKDISLDLFEVKKDALLNVSKTGKEDTPKLSDNMINIANENLTEDKGKIAMDSLALMKKVKEIVDFDLKNAIKIFEDKEPESKNVMSVLTLVGDDWKVSSEELKKCVEVQKNKTNIEINLATDQKNFKIGSLDSIDEKKSKVDDESLIPKYFPPKKEKESAILLKSVINYNDNGNYEVDAAELKQATERRLDSFNELNNPNVFNILGENKNDLIVREEEIKKFYEAKRGDSILVFDENTQSWKVDYSILERREEQQREEQELMKRSELILETFEKLEKSHISQIPKPESRDKQIFDYSTEEWKVFPPEKKSKSSSKSAKLPFKESNAEEVRKKNSDLYEDLFITKKKEITLNKNGKTAPGLDSSGAKKEGKAYNSCSVKKEAKDEGSITNKTDPPKDPQNQSPDMVSKEVSTSKDSSSSGASPPVNNISNKSGTPKEDDNFWDAFLKMNILPRTIAELPKVREIPLPTPNPSSPKPPPVVPPPSSNPPKVEAPKPKISPKKIEEPRFRIPNPFWGDKSKKPSTPRTTEKVEKPPQTPSGGSAKVEEQKMKTPPPTTPVKQEDPKSKKPPTIGALKDSEIKVAQKNETVTIKIDINKPEVQTFSGPVKKEKTPEDHYISENIVQMSRNSEKNVKPKTNKIETVKLNITADKRLPSKITEINLNKKCEEKGKDTPNEQKKVEGTLKKTEKTTIENKNFYRNFEKYKTPFSDPEYEEKSMKINSDLESNPNLKKLDNWNKTLVLQDIGKSSENMDTWLKDETDKMASLLLKVLQDAADGKPKKKVTKKIKSDKGFTRSNPYDNIRKKQETNANSFLFKIRPIDFDANGNLKTEDVKVGSKSDPGFKDIPLQSSRSSKPAKTIDVVKLPMFEKDTLLSPSGEVIRNPQSHLQDKFEEKKSKMSEAALEAVDISGSRNLFNENKSFELTEEIPGPEILKKISNTWKMFPILGSQLTIFTLLRVFQLVNAGVSFIHPTNTSKNRRQAFNNLFTKYGPIVNVQGPLSGNVILIHKPEHLIGVFEQDMAGPVRSVFDSLENCRRDLENKNQTTGILTDWNRPDWFGLKRAFRDPLTKGCENFFSGVESAGESLISCMKRNRNGQNFVSDDFMEDIKRWSTEGLCNVLFEKSFNFLEGRSSNSNWLLEPDKLYQAIEEATYYLSKCEKGFQIWRLIGTPSSVGLGDSYKTLSNLLSKQLYQAELNLKSKNAQLKNGKLSSRDLTFVESMLLYDGMNIDEITCNLIDIMLVGINSMSSALGFLLYNLAQNTKVQNKLLKEVKETLPDKTSRLDYHKLHSLKYLQACLKESLRLHMPIPIFFRMLQNDILLSNYIIPKGTYIVMDSKNSCMKEQIFDDPDKFIPERWLKEEKWMQNVNPFSSFPFCHGPRAGLAKRVAEMQLWSCLAKIVRNFQVEYHFGEIEGMGGIVSFPNKPLKLNFVERGE